MMGMNDILAYICSKSSDSFIYFIGVFIFKFFLVTGTTGSQLPNQGSNLHPLHWKHAVLTTRPPGKSPDHLKLALRCRLRESRSRSPHVGVVTIRGVNPCNDLFLNQSYAQANVPLDKQTNKNKNPFHFLVGSQMNVVFLPYQN